MQILCVCLFPILITSVYILMRGRRDCHGSRRFHVKKFGLNTSTTVLRTHLVESHLQEWVDACDAQGFTITAAVAKDKAEEYRASRGLPTDGSNTCDSSPFDSEPQQRPFSQEAFIDSLVTWIVSDDQVSPASIC